MTYKVRTKRYYTGVAHGLFLVEANSEEEAYKLTTQLLKDNPMERLETIYTGDSDVTVRQVIKLC